MQQGELKGILWHQGEADARPDRRDAYPEKLAALVNAIRTDLDAPNAPFIAGEINSFREAGVAFNAMLRDAVRPIERCTWVSSEGVDHTGDGIHFDSPSQRLMGQMYAEAYLMLIEDDGKAADSERSKSTEETNN